MGAVWFVKFRFNISIQFLILLSNPDGCKNWWTHKFIIFLTLYVILIIYYVNKSVFLNPSHIPISILFISSNIKYVFVVTIKPPPHFEIKLPPSMVIFDVLTKSLTYVCFGIALVSQKYGFSFFFCGRTQGDFVAVFVSGSTTSFTVM